jgi:hypothetical protein
MQLSQEIFNILKGANIKLKLFDPMGNKTLDPELSARFYAYDNDFLVTIREEEDGVELVVQAGASFNFNEHKDLLNSIKKAGHNAMAEYNIRKFDKNIELKDFAHDVVKEDEEIRRLKELSGIKEADRSDVTHAQLVPHIKNVKAAMIRHAQEDPSEANEFIEHLDDMMQVGDVEVVDMMQPDWMDTEARDSLISYFKVSISQDPALYNMIFPGEDIKWDQGEYKDMFEAEKRWKQTSMSPEEAIEKYGKENVKVKKGALRNGDDMVEVFVESYSPGDEYADSEGMVSNCCGAPMMDYNDGFGRCSDCKEMASGESEEEYYEATEGSNAMNTLRKIVADKQNMPVKFDDGSMKVDLFSASAITQVYDAVKPETREKMDKLLKTKAGMMKVQAFSMKAFESEEFQGNQIKESSCDCCDSDPCDCGPDCGCGCNSVKESKEMMTEAQFDEAAGEKDACYRKVKSRYKVWPSAYASGALVKCRKVGASNWGNSKK